MSSQNQNYSLVTLNDCLVPGFAGIMRESVRARKSAANNCAQSLTDREPTPALPHALSLCVNAPDYYLIHPSDCCAPHP